MRRMGTVLTGLLAGGVLAGAAAGGATAPASQPDAARADGDRPPLALRRIVKAFDFDERRYGNYGKAPLGWRQHVAEGYFQFLEGAFDPATGHAAPPSFRLDLDGGSLAFHYTGRDIAVRRDCDYLVVIRVRTESLETARAYATACFLDRKGVEIPGTQRRTRLVGGPGTPADWEALTLDMRCSHPDARYLGLSLWLTQRRVWNTEPQPVRAIERENIKGTAWFDDIAVYRMPRVALSAGRPGGVFSERDPVELVAELSDPDGLSLTGLLSVRDADGRVIHERAVPVAVGDQKPATKILLPDLPVGRYEADLVVATAGTTLVRQSMRFVRVAERMGQAGGQDRGFGVVLTDVEAAGLTGQRQLLKELGPRWVKVPVWSAQQALLHRSATGPAVDTCLEAVREVQADPIGILRDDAAPAASRVNAGLMSMLDLFKEPPSAWKHLIAGVWLRYAGLIQVWQIGADDQPMAWSDDADLSLVPRIRKEMSELMSEPSLATTSSVRLPPEAAGPADYRSVLLPASVSPRDIAGHLQGHAGQDPQHLWVTVVPLPEGAYPRALRLADLGRRLAETSFAGAGAVFMRAPWAVRAHPSGTRVEPSEDYIVLRTVANVLTGARPCARTTLDGTVECLVFDHGGTAVLCVWDDRAPPGGRDHRIELGGGVQQIDLWGRRVFPSAAGRRQVVRIGPTPTFLLNCPTWLVEFRRQFAVRPDVVEARFGDIEVDVEFRNTHPDPISGFVRLVLPDEWDIRPNRLAFSLAPGGVFRQTVALRFPPNAQTQIMPLVGEFAIDAERRYEFTAPAWFEFGVAGLDMDACAYRSQKRVTVRLSMTNRTDQTLHFEASLIAPNRQRLERQFSNFQPGATLTRSFVIPDAQDLAGRNVRVSLKEIQGGRFWNRIIAIP